MADDIKNYSNPAEAIPEGYMNDDHPERPGEASKVTEIVTDKLTTQATNEPTVDAAE